jgi:23S rRNA pseudouridine1911/1915/1917 synthase
MPGPFILSGMPDSAVCSLEPSTPPPAPSNAKQQTLLDWLVRRYPTAKRQTLKRMVQAGRVRVGGRVARKLAELISDQAKVVVGDTVRGSPSAARAKLDPRLRIVYDDADLLVVDKPAGLLTSTVPREPRPTLLSIVRAYVEARGPGTPVGLIHRLDRDASGLLVFSRGNDAYRSLKRQFFEHSVERVYTAVAEGVPRPDRGRVESILRERADGTVYSLRRGSHGKGERAETEYETLAVNGGRALVRVTLHTGRKHQIRVHLSERGTPIVGDTVYGDAEKMPRPTKNDRPPAPRLMLAATKLSLTHPGTGKRLTFELPPPKEFAEAFGAPIEPIDR